ncbi:probable E3 ubiquitin-protein ligase hip1 [Phtheirospermum japonicum]|uniref:RING-type E3 ubiquitin transferase n=1 Tax=Phtheirospermum japonicum TaxID=374723 RepID=A0A830CRM1_9LAMI|nr:probable E3 ubiquitin-protein ligase hip1 [Phtheirospermum japonicum]
MGRCLKKRKVICEDDYVDKVCALCLDDLFGDGDDVATIVGFLDNCGHEFHVGCVKKWLIKKNSCPLCRATAFTAP